MNELTIKLSDPQVFLLFKAFEYFCSEEAQAVLNLEFPDLDEEKLYADFDNVVTQFKPLIDRIENAKRV